MQCVAQLLAGNPFGDLGARRLVDVVINKNKTLKVRRSPAKDKQCEHQASRLFAGCAAHVADFPMHLNVQNGGSRAQQRKQTLGARSSYVHSCPGCGPGQRNTTCDARHLFTRVPVTT